MFGNVFLIFSKSPKLISCVSNVSKTIFWKDLILFRMDIFRAAHGWGDQKGAPCLKPVTHILQWQLGTVITYLKNIKKIYEWRDTHPGFCGHQHFFTGNQQILLCQKTQIYIAFYYIISNSFSFLESLNGCLINLVIILMSAKMATPSLLKITVFWNKGYDVIIFVNDVTNNILSRDSNYIVDVFMWRKFGKCSISMKEVITTSIL